MNNKTKLLNIKNFGEVRTVCTEDGTWYVANDIAKALGYAKPNNAINTHCQSGKKQFIPHPQSSDKRIEVNIINEHDIIRLVEKSRTLSEEQKILFLEGLGIIKNDVVVINSRKEVEFFDVLKSQLKVLGVRAFERQYSNLQCGNYRIDMYLPELNIAIEYDELLHQYYTYEQQELRQKLIEEELGCTFIRVSEEKSHSENSAIVIKHIIKNL